MIIYKVELQEQDVTVLQNCLNFQVSKGQLVFTHEMRTYMIEILDRFEGFGHKVAATKEIITSAQKTGCIRKIPADDESESPLYLAQLGSDVSLKDSYAEALDWMITHYHRTHQHI